MNIGHVDFRHNRKHIKINSSRIIALLLAFSIIFLYGCDIQSLTWQPSETVDEVVRNIENNKSELDYNDYLEVTLKEPEIVKDVTDGLEPGTNYVSENIIIKNKSKSPIKIFCRAYLPKEIIATIARAPITFDPVKIVELEPEKELDMAAAIIMKKTDNMTEEEKSIFYKYSRIVYVEVVIDGKHCYFKAQV